MKGDEQRTYELESKLLKWGVVRGSGAIIKGSWAVPLRWYPRVP